MSSNPTTLIRELRELMPRRALENYEQEIVAERQAIKLASILAAGEPAVDLSPLLELPRIAVKLDSRLAKLGISGVSESYRGGWTITINSMDSQTRRRFTLVHEFKHVIDHPFARMLYRQDGDRDNPEAERICDYFAACLLMPKTVVKRLWYSGLQDVRALAAKFRVSPAAMNRRLQDIGLIDRSFRYHAERYVEIARYFRPMPSVEIFAV